MPRKVIDNTPILMLALYPAYGHWDKATAGYELTEARNTLRPILKKLLGCEVDLDWRIDEDARCEFCNSTWTEESPDYNGGCCGKDEERNPDAEQVAA